MQLNDEAQRLQYAYSLHQRGDVDQAAGLYREIIDRNPNNYYALHFLGLVETSAGNFERAKPLMARSLAIRPPNIQFIENYAALLVTTENHASALDICQEGLKLDPGGATFLYLSAVSLLGLGRAAQALERFASLLRRQPNHVAALTAQSLALAQLERYPEAWASLKKALALDPLYADAHVNTGVLCVTTGRSEEALDAYDKALAINPQLAKAWFGRAKAHQQLNMHERAIADYERGLALSPSEAEAHHAKARALLELGRLDQAKDAVEKAIDLAPRTPAFYLTLALVGRFAAGDARLQALEALAEDISALTREDQGKLHFALAAALQQVGDHERSFQWLLKGNALKRQGSDYDENAAINRLTSTIRTFSADYLRRREGLGFRDQKPIFIIGMPRSGSTLIEQILASHPDVVGAGETNDFHLAMKTLGGPVAQAAASPEAAATISGEEWARLGARYVDKIQSNGSTAKRFTDKTLENFLLVGFIRLALPDARIIHTKRNSLDTCLSCFSILFEDNQPYAYDLAELGRYYRAYEGVMAHWREVLPPGVMLEAQYEDVVGNLEGEARRILAFCGLEWDPRCLDFHKTERPVRTASFAQVRQPIFSSSIGRWRLYEKQLEPLFAELGKRS